MKAYIAVPVTLLMVHRAWSHQSLTPAGIVAAVFTAIAHAVHPWSLPFALLIVFFLAGSRVTKVKHDVKAKLTLQASGSAGGEGARTHIQVFANSAVASILTLLHAYHLRQRDQNPNSCYSLPGDILVVGIVANYAAVAADTFSSELGILSKSKPRLITSLNLREVPPGTNGGVTLYGLLAGLLGSLIIVTTSVALIPFCSPKTKILGLPNAHGWSFLDRQRFAFAMTLWGALGSVLDSFLGGWLQQSVRDTRTGRIVEGEGGKTVLVSGGPNSMHLKKRAEVKAKMLNGEGKDPIITQSDSITAQIEDALNERMGGSDDPTKSRQSSVGDEKPSRVVESGTLALLDNNEVNFLMALTVSLGAMGIASWWWAVPFGSIFSI